MRARDVVLHHHRCPDINGIARKRARKISGSNTDDCEVVLVEGYLLSNHVWIGPEVALPQSIADHRDRMRIGCAILFGKKRPPDKRLHPEDVEIVARNYSSFHPRGFITAAQIHREHLMRDQARQSGCTITKIEVIEVGCRERGVVTRSAPDFYQLVRSLHARQRCQQNRLDPGENGSVRSDAQSQGHHDRERKARPFQEHSDAVS